MLTEVLMKIPVFRSKTLCRGAYKCQRIGQVCCLSLQGSPELHSLNFQQQQQMIRCTTPKRCNPDVTVHCSKSSSYSRDKTTLKTQVARFSETLVTIEAYYPRRREFSMLLSLLHGDTAEQSSATNYSRSKPEGSQNHGTSRTGSATADTHCEVRFRRLVSLLTTCCYFRRSMKSMPFQTSI